MVLQSALLQMRDETVEMADKLAGKTRFKRVDWAAIEAYLPQTIVDEVLKETGQPPLPRSPPPNSPQPLSEADAQEETSAAASEVKLDMRIFHSAFDTLHGNTTDAHEAKCDELETERAEVGVDECAHSDSDSERRMRSARTTAQRASRMRGRSVKRADSTSSLVQSLTTCGSCAPNQPVRRQLQQ